MKKNMEFCCNHSSCASIIMSVMDPMDSFFKIEVDVFRLNDSLKLLSEETILEQLECLHVAADDIRIHAIK